MPFVRWMDSTEVQQSSSSIGPVKTRRSTCWCIEHFLLNYDWLVVRRFVVAMNSLFVYFSSIVTLKIIGLYRFQHVVSSSTMTIALILTGSLALPSIDPLWLVSSLCTCLRNRRWEMCVRENSGAMLMETTRRESNNLIDHVRQCRRELRVCHSARNDIERDGQVSSTSAASCVRWRVRSTNNQTREFNRSTWYIR